MIFVTNLNYDNSILVYIYSCVSCTTTVVWTNIYDIIYFIWPFLDRIVCFFQWQFPMRPRYMLSSTKKLAKCYYVWIHQILMGSFLLKNFWSSQSCHPSHFAQFVGIFFLTLSCQLLCFWSNFCLLTPTHHHITTSPHCKFTRHLKHSLTWLNSPHFPLHQLLLLL